MNEFLNELAKVVISYASELFLLLITAFMARIVGYVRSYIQRNMSKDIVSDVVRYVEQMYDGISSSEKYTEAVNLATDKLSCCKINLSADELKLLIESAVNEFFGKTDKGAQK